MVTPRVQAADSAQRGGCAVVRGGARMCKLEGRSEWGVCARPAASVRKYDSREHRNGQWPRGPCRAPGRQPGDRHLPSACRGSSSGCRYSSGFRACASGSAASACSPPVPGRSTVNSPGASSRRSCGTAPCHSPVAAQRSLATAHATARTASARPPGGSHRGGNPCRLPRRLRATAVGRLGGALRSHHAVCQLDRQQAEHAALLAASCACGLDPIAAAAAAQLPAALRALS